MTVLQASSLYKAPSYMLDGYSLSSMDTFDGDSETIIRAVYRGLGQPTEIYRVRRYDRPIDVYMPPSDAATVIEAASLNGKPAILSYPRPGSFLDRKGFTRVSFVEGEIETTVMGPGLELESAIRIAGSVEAGGPVSEMTTGVLDLNEGDDGTSGQAVVSATPPVSATEHRIIEGIATNSALVYNWWHGAGYGHTALDLLKIPEGETPGADVYYESYAWTGPAGFLASVLYYPGTCTGVRVALLDAGLNTVGLVDYVHIQSTVSEGQWWWVLGSGWTSQHVGTVLADETDACKATGWDGAHLHHAIKTGYDYIQENTDLEGYLAQQGHENVIEPAYDYLNQWVFRAFTIDADGDGCTDSQEANMGFDPSDYWDFYDVPIPANDDPTPNGTRNRAVNMQDVAGVLKYVGTADNDPPNANGVDYDSTKDGDWNGDTVVTEEADQVGLRYDRSPGPLPNPPYDAGPPDGAVNFQDVVMVLNQVGLDCTGGIDGPDDADGAPSGDGDALDSAPNAMAVDAIPGGGVDPTRTVTGTAPFDVTVLITAAGSAYAGYDLTLSYDDQVLAFVPTVDLNRDTVAESWSYTGLGGMGLKARVTGSDRDGDTVVDTATGGAASSSGTSTATGAVVTGSFRCVGDGTSPLHLVAPAEAVLSTDTIAEDGGAIDTSLTDASVTCQGVQ